MRKTVAIGIIGVGLLAGCSAITVPIAAIGDNGDQMSGTATANLDGNGEFTVIGPHGNCTGNYDAYDMSLTIPVALLCADGTRALGSVTRTASGVSGSGSMTDTNGVEWRIVFGENATALF